jgi:hypothetical protein
MQASLEETLNYARDANKYAQSIIKKGNNIQTSFAFSESFEEYQRAICKDVWVAETRTFIQDVIKEKIINDDLINNPLLIFFETFLELSEKFSVGNCNELAFHALAYIINQLQSCVSAEIFRIENGDHLFIVLNRALNSDAKNPNSWGEAAVICDPLADKAYKATHYLTELQNYYFRGGTAYTQNFNPSNPSKHVLACYDKYNTNNLNALKAVNEVKYNFEQKIQQLRSTLDLYSKGLDKEVQRIQNRYSKDARIDILNTKIQELAKTDNKLKLHLEQAKNIELRTFKEANLHFVPLWKDCQRFAMQSMQFSSNDQAILTDFPPGLDANMMRFFNQKSTAHKNLEKITKEANQFFPK